MEISWEALRQQDADETARRLRAEIAELRRRTELLEHALDYVKAAGRGEQLRILPFAQPSETTDEWM